MSRLGPENGWPGPAAGSAGPGMDAWRPGPEAVRVLSVLLDKYERSRALTDGPSARRPQVRMADGVVPGYTGGSLDPDARRTLHQDLARLADAGIVDLRWVRFEEGNLLDRVYLEWDGVHQAYALTGRTPLRDEMAVVVQEVAAWRRRQVAKGSPAWVLNWADDVVAAVQARGRVGSQLLPPDPEDRRALLQALGGLVEKGDEVLPVRLFSTRYLGDSKAFERQVQGRLLGLLQRYALPTWGVDDPDVFSDPADLLREVGLEVTHDLITFCGPAVISFSASAGWSAQGAEDGEGDGQGLASGRDHEVLRTTHAVDACAFPHGVAVDAADVDGLVWQEVRCARILTIENKANYRAYVRRERNPDELVVYLGGFASPGQRRFLRSLRRWHERQGRTLPSLDHWGDLDYGGILILQHLRDTCWPEARPWRMEPEWLSRHRDRLEPFDDAYRDKLARLLEQERYRWARPLIEALLTAGGTLEQEALLI
ncbi:MAG: DUF2220 domain-containing protein [Alicyclobacillus macrosporangiidus]|uniref:Wadjet anti-phage system protein JetD domain-containing protein n=1 Tax=Alicyclobacillus macrosporangiidus TaxID=392015 RepID=UPI0026F1789F|nr:Wadjet anti-phage system protein JetD domain-containing protein [Alicyclobacillus macrosporangiidus]MCL6599272.1 DUF2220 domain-containing protein [Alicyclobacillus macrosporangiidus]